MGCQVQLTHVVPHPQPNAMLRPTPVINSILTLGQRQSPLALVVVQSLRAFRQASLFLLKVFGKGSLRLL